MEFLCFDFINSQWYKTHDLYIEPLKDRNWIKELLERWNMDIDISLSDHQFEQLITLRTLLYDILVDISLSGEINNKKIEKINYYLALTPLHFELNKEGNTYSVTLEPIYKDLNYILNKIARSFVEVILTYDINRIRLCENSACRWVFYDESKNHSRKWCSNTCSSLIKVRRFREKKKR